MEAPANIDDLATEFVAVTGAAPHIAAYYLESCNYDLNRAIEFFFEHPPGEGGGAQAARVEEPDDDPPPLGDVGFGGAYGGHGEGVGAPGGQPLGAGEQEDEELQRALAESMGEAGLAPAPGRVGAAAPRAQPGRRHVEVLDDDDEELPDADEMLQEMAARQEAARAAERASRAHMEELMNRMLGGSGRGVPGLGGTVDPPAGYPGFGMFPGISGRGGPLPGAGRRGAGRGPGRAHGLAHDDDDDDLDAAMVDDAAFDDARRMIPGPRGGRAGPRGPGGFGDLEDEGGEDEQGATRQQRRRVEVRRGAAAPAGLGVGLGGGAAAAGGAGAGARGSGAGYGGPGAAPHHDDGWDEGIELPEGMSRHELEEARMMEAALLGVPYQGRMPDFSNPPNRGGAGGAYGGGAEALDPELMEHRELRYDQDRAYEESLAADRAKAAAAARVKAEAEAKERAEREEAERVARAAADEAARLAALVEAKRSRLPAEPPTSAPEALTVMVRLPDGSRHSRRFAKSDHMSSLFDFVDVELDAAAKAAAGAAAGGSGAGEGAALKPGSYNLVTQFPRKVFAEADSGGRSFEEAGFGAGGGGLAFFIEQRPQ